MPRPREFDEAAALEAAMRRFWADGFAGTSVRDLGDAMGLGQASVYNAFGDKRTLFTQCLDRYLDANMRARIARVEKSLPPRPGDRDFPDKEIVERSLESRLGCLLANAALEVAPHDPEIAAVVAERMGELEAFFRRCVIAGQRDGSISPGVDPADAARLLPYHSDGAARSRARLSKSGGARRRCPASAFSVAGEAQSARESRRVRLANNRKRPAMIRFYYHPTPNPLKISLFLEETGLPYEVLPIDTSKGEQHQPAFRKINPNGKVPAIIDTDRPGAVKRPVCSIPTRSCSTSPTRPASSAGFAR